jgi:plasmid maintenance system antidote protein, XRE family
MRHWLIDIIQKKHLTHSIIAKNAKITRSYFTQIVSGRRRPSPDVAKRIAAVLGFANEWYKLLDDKKH